MSVRIDKWLWAARFYKTRSKAKNAVAAGHVRVNGDRVKAAKDVHVGDKLSILREDFPEDVVIMQLSEKRQAAPIAQRLYEETAASIQRREKAYLERKSKYQSDPNPDRRPTKAERRQLLQLKNTNPK